MRTLAEHPEWAMCLGGGSCVWEDVAAWEAIYGKPWDGLVIAANDIGCHWARPLHHWVSLHPIKFRFWEPKRAELSRSWADPATESTTEYTTWSRMTGSLNNKVSPITDRSVAPWAGGSSGFLAVQVAQEVGCTRVILCGIPMTMTPHFAESRERFTPVWNGVNGHWKAWSRNPGRVMGWVRSMSGRTRELLGFPTLEWLYDSQESDHATVQARSDSAG